MTPVLSIHEAREIGAKFYHGRPCLKCGDTVRYLSCRSCASCNRESMQKRGYSPKKNKAASLMKLYGITLDDYDVMLKSQNGVCAVCHSSCKTGRSLAVDHCHSTGAVRGLLCANCNRAIGLFQEDRSRMTAAIAYIDRHAPRAA